MSKSPNSAAYVTGVGLRESDIKTAEYYPLKWTVTTGATHFLSHPFQVSHTSPPSPVYRLITSRFGLRLGPFVRWRFGPTLAPGPGPSVRRWGSASGFGLWAGPWPGGRLGFAPAGASGLGLGVGTGLGAAVAGPAAGPWVASGPAASATTGAGWTAGEEQRSG